MLDEVKATHSLFPDSSRTLTGTIALAGDPASAGSDSTSAASLKHSLLYFPVAVLLLSPLWVNLYELWGAEQDEKVWNNSWQ